MEILTAVAVMGAATVLVSSGFSGYQAEQQFSRETAIYQQLAHQRLQALLAESPGPLLSTLGPSTTPSMNVLALAPARWGDELRASGSGQNALDVGAARIAGREVREIPRSQPQPADLLVDTMGLAIGVCATKLEPVGGKWTTYKYQVTVMRADPEGGPSRQVYALCGFDADYDSSGK